MYRPSFRRDPADDGIEVLVIRREMEIAAGRSLHWSDADGRVIYPPMTTAQCSERGIEL
jgi:hypothetical protein